MGDVMDEVKVEERSLMGAILVAIMLILYHVCNFCLHH